MEQTADILELKFEGNGINPSLVRPHEIAELIVNFERSLLSTIKELHPEIDTEQLLFSFNSIQDQSLDLRFIPQKIKDIVETSFILIATCITIGEFHQLNNDTLSSLRTITKFSKRYNCAGQLNFNNKTYASFTPKTEIPLIKNRVLKGETTVFGKLIDVGGNNPNVHLRINDEYDLIFNTSIQNAKYLANKLYDKIALTGVAKWEAETLKIIDFKLNDIVDYIPNSSRNAIAELKKITSGYWDQFNNNDEINDQLFRE